METTDQELAARLMALEAAVPVHATLRPMPARPRLRRVAVSVTLAPVVLVAVVASVAAGAIAVGSLAQTRPGVENDGQPMAGLRMECMTPPEAGALLAAHGLTNVTWQVESGTAAVGGNKGETRTVQQRVPPEHGFVVPGSVLEDGSVIMVVDQRTDATGSGSCPELLIP